MHEASGPGRESVCQGEKPGLDLEELLPGEKRKQGLQKTLRSRTSWSRGAKVTRNETLKMSARFQL